MLSASSDKPFSGHADDVLLAGLLAVGKTLVPYNEHHAGVDLLAHLVSVCSDRPHSAVRCTDHSESRSGHASFLVVGLQPQRLRSGVVVDDEPKSEIGVWSDLGTHQSGGEASPRFTTLRRCTDGTLFHRPSPFRLVLNVR